MDEDIVVLVADQHGITVEEVFNRACMYFWKAMYPNAVTNALYFYRRNGILQNWVELWCRMHDQRRKQ